MISREKKYDILVILIDYVNFPRFFATFPDLAPVSQSVLMLEFKPSVLG